MRRPNHVHIHVHSYAIHRPATEPDSGFACIGLTIRTKRGVRDADADASHPIPSIIPCGGTCIPRYMLPRLGTSLICPYRRRRHTRSSARALTLYPLSPRRPSLGLSVGSASRCLVITLLAYQPQFLKTHSLAIAAAPTAVTSPDGSHLSERLSLSEVGRRALKMPSTRRVRARRASVCVTVGESTPRTGTYVRRVLSGNGSSFGPFITIPPTDP